MGKESAFTRQFCEWLEAAGAETVAFVGGKFQPSGIADRYFCHSLFRGWVEFKEDENTVKTHQMIFLERLQKKGDTCLVVRHHGKSDRVEVEDARGRQLNWLDMRPLRVYDDLEAGFQLLRLLRDAKEKL